jgi:hypothetical protein
MRLWTLHPKYLDAKGLVAAWREGLLARKVLQGKTFGYTAHPQLDRFKKRENPVAAINIFLFDIFEESRARGYRFDETKIFEATEAEYSKIPVSSGQIAYEIELLKWKLERRDKGRLSKLSEEPNIALNRVFTMYEGKIEVWEKVLPEIVERLRRLDTKR